MSFLTALKLLHLAGLMMGFGGAILADFLILNRAILAPVHKQTIKNVRQLSHIVLAGLGILWVSGAALIYTRYSMDPAFLLNEKVWAKVVIVAILTVNGVAVHSIALTHLQSRAGRQMFTPSLPRYMLGLTFVAAVSSVSWLVPFVLGVASEFNFTVPAVTILGVYAVMVLGAWGVFYGLAMLVSVPDSILAQQEWDLEARYSALNERFEQFTDRPLLSAGLDGSSHKTLSSHAAPKAEKLSDIIRRLEQFQMELNATPDIEQRRAA